MVSVLVAVATLLCDRSNAYVRDGDRPRGRTIEIPLVLAVVPGRWCTSGTCDTGAWRSKGLAWSYHNRENTDFL